MQESDFIQSQVDYLRAYLNNLPDVLTADDLAKVMGISVQRIRSRRVEQRKGALDVLPTPFVIPGSNLLMFTRNSVIDWFVRAQAPKQFEPAVGKRGRPVGSKSRKGIGRPALEGRAS